ncbi:uncharacterized protein LOC133828823 [Humulus lupulus]|uniref:uncharacterized protein LOC133828823 n=1 Tax=Humulus lupulus TaxID=3486 RepID=UPI002B4046C7|nr:uncharacterized protein LOC133828823 [Humulus lupulus]
MASIPEYLYSSLDHHYTLFPTTTTTTTDLISGLPTMAEDGGAASSMWCANTTAINTTINDHHHLLHHRELLVPFYGGITSTTTTTNNTASSSSTINNYGFENNALSSSPTDSLVSSTSSLSPAFMVSAAAAAFPEQSIVGVADGGAGFVPAAGAGAGALYSHDYLSGFSNIISNDHLHGFSAEVHNYGGYNNNSINGFVEFGDQDSCATSFLPEFKPVGLVAAGDQNWLGMQSCNQMHGIEDSNMMKVSRYSEEERKERIVRYLKKRNQRNFNKTIKYACRKTLADRRVRVRGRFARNNELCQLEHEYEQMVPKKKELLLSDHNNTSCQQTDFCCDDDIADTVQIKYDDEEDWLQDFALCCFVNGGPNSNK